VLHAAVSLAETGRRDLDLCVLLDVSGSMGGEATIGKEGAGLTLLDVAKHGVRTVLTAMGPGDRVAVYAFNHTTIQLVGLQSAGPEAPLSFLEPVTASGGTDIGPALELAFRILEAEGRDAATRACFLLTDGDTQNKHLCEKALANSRQRCDGRAPLLCTFGVGYDIDSELLTRLALRGGGFFSFVPDAGFVGTAFVQATAAVLCVALEQGRISIEDSADGHWEGQPPRPREEHQCAALSARYSGGESHLFWVRSGEEVEDDRGERPHSRRRLSCADGDAPCLAVEGYLGGSRRLENISKEVLGTSSCPDVLVERIREQTFTAMLQNAGMAIGQKEAYEKAVVALEALDAAQLSAAGRALRTGLLFDLQGQVAEALEPQAYRKWGRHYLLSLACAHCQRVTLNFKDQGTQAYMSRTVKSLRDDLDAIFNTLPEPSSTLAVRHRSIAVPVRMADLNDTENVCIHGDAKVLRLGSGRVPISSLLAGDSVWAVAEGSGGQFEARYLKVLALCVQEAGGSSTVQPFADVPNVRVTPGHPVLRFKDAVGRYVDPLQRRWHYPVAPCVKEDESTGAARASSGSKVLLISVVLEDPRGKGVVLLSDSDAIVAVSLAHGMTDASAYGACAHNYLGSRRRVLDDLQRFEDYPHVRGARAARNELGHVQMLTVR